MSTTGHKTCGKCGRSYCEDSAIAELTNGLCLDCAIQEALNNDRGLGGEWNRIATTLIRAKYRPGMRVRLIRMQDFQAPPVGTEGTVLGVDDIGSILMSWDNGSGLNVIPGEDEIEIIDE